ncbi:protein inscuteable homolog isoform X2 [Eriocheir sinensis]|nr:protein inscuteable homolog isoform X2 [Eriocheir sinensis]XP_050727212.1 protein inscuteable homolog isoform X2 [Eriocheir sinensis]XP_050727213.1 protein inscuteable homolog isoform X2 [Eriocheir sinensis]XP_050727214.1 protein inscuteable homolog isoform X2 [Eriocheir sinensis]
MTPPVVKAAQGKQDGSRTQHFRRGGSRVYYASETGCWPANNLPKSFWAARSKCIGESVVHEAAEEASSSGEEAGEEEVSPGGLFRGYLRGSPSHRSQDSGYSDSGESTNAHNDTDSIPTTPPNVKHITRVYFGENPHLYNDKIVCVPKINIITTSGAVTSPPADATPPDKEPIGTHLQPFHQRGRAASLEELAEELEHKSVLEAATRRTGAVRKRSSNSAGMAVPRWLQRRSSSVEKLIADGQQDRRQTGTSRARRRWSLGEAAAPVPGHRQQQGPASYVTSGTNTHVPLSQQNRKPKVELMSRGVDTSSLECEDDRSGVPRLAGDTDLRAAVTPAPAHPRPTRTHPATVAREMRNDSLHQWVKELRILCEAECMNTLQSKSLPGDPARPPASSPPTVRHAVRAIQRRAHAVSTEFARLCQRLEWLELTQVPPLAESLVEHINTFLRDYTTQWAAADPDLQPQSSLSRQSKVIRQICERMMEVCTGDHDDLDRDTTCQVVQVVTALGHAFTKLVDLMLSREIREMVRVLEEPGSRAGVRLVVSHLTALGVEGGHICRLIASLGGVRGLLDVCLEPRLRQCRSDALRALATVCCVVEGIAELDKAGGVEVVTEVLCDTECPEEERSEAAGVLAQITSPWVENTHRLAALHTHLAPIVAALTDLAKYTLTPEIFLLASAALANLTFLDGGCVEAMRTAGTARVLLRAAQDNPNLSIFTKDQIATVLANLVGSKEVAEEVVEGGGVAVLLALLNTRPAPTHRLPEVATAERVQQKSAIALSRLCREASVARQVAKQGGAERLVQLCKDERERNHSDAVLVACLAALRKMSSSLGAEGLQGIDAAELVEPRLLDSFLIYSSRQESFV